MVDVGWDGCGPYLFISPWGLDMGNFHQHIECVPAVDSPLIFGLHPNADITYRLKEASEMLTTIIETQPKDSSASVPCFDFEFPAL